MTIRTLLWNILSVCALLLPIAYAALQAVAQPRTSALPHKDGVCQTVARIRELQKNQDVVVVVFYGASTNVQEAFVSDLHRHFGGNDPNTGAFILCGNYFLNQKVTKKITWFEFHPLMPRKQVWTFATQGSKGQNPDIEARILKILQNAKKNINVTLGFVDPASNSKTIPGSYDFVVTAPPPPKQKRGGNLTLDNLPQLFASGALSKIKELVEKEGTEHVYPFLQHDEPEVRTRAIRVLRKTSLEETETVQHLVNKLEDTATAVSHAAFGALSDVDRGNTDAVSIIIEGAQKSLDARNVDPVMIMKLVGSIDTGLDELHTVLGQAISDPNDDVIRLALNIVHRFVKSGRDLEIALPLLCQAIVHKNPRVRKKVSRIRSDAVIKNPDTVYDVLHLFNDTIDPVLKRELKAVLGTVAAGFLFQGHEAAEKVKLIQESLDCSQ